MQKINPVTKVRVNHSYDRQNRNSSTIKSVDKLTLRPSNFTKNPKQIPVIQKPQPLIQKMNLMKVPFHLSIPKQPFIFNEESEFGEGLCEWLQEVIQYSSLACQKRAFSEHLSQEQIRNQFSKIILGHLKEFGESLKDLKVQNKYLILVFMDKSIKEIMKQYLPKYMPVQLNQANWVEQLNLELIDIRSDEFDFLLNNGLTLQYQKYENYTPFIMTVINKIVDIETEFTKDFNSTYSESFRGICERIAGTIQQKRVSKMQHIKRLSNVNLNDNTNKKQLIRVSKRSLKLKSNDQNIAPVQKCVIKDINKDKVKQYRLNSNSLQSSKVKMMQINRNSNPFFETKFTYQLNKFTDQQILVGDLTCHSSALIKILLKWVEQLEQILFNSQQAIKKKMSKFKTHSGKLINLFSFEKKILLKYILQEKNAMASELENFKMEYRVLQTKFLQQKSFGKFLKIEANLGAFCSKTLEALTQYLLRYLNKLIHILLLATVRAANAPNQFYPEHVTPDERNESKQKLKSLNLVTFKINDLFISKFKCTQATFPIFIEQMISLAHEHMFKIVRVQDERNQPEGNLILNIFFENKILSQFHLYVHKNDEIRQNLKNSLYGAMNKIVKANFGAIFKLCLIISQCDPMIKNYCQYKDKSFLKRKQTKGTTKKELTEMRNFLQKNNIKASLEKPFICDECEQLKIVLNPKLFDRVADWDHLICNECKQHTIRKSNEESKKFFQLSVKKNANITKEIQIKYDYLKLINTKEIDIKNLPKFGFYISLSCKTPIVKPFKMITSDNHMQPCLITLNQLDKPQTLIQIDKHQNWIHQFDKIMLYQIDTTIFGWADESGYIPYLQALIKKIDKIQKQTVEFSLKLKRFLQCLKQKQGLIFMNGNIGIGNEIAKYLGQIQAECSLGVEIYMSQALDESKQIKYQRRRKEFGRLAVETKSLQLEDCGITQINNYFNQFLQLKELNLTNNKIICLQNFQDMTQLETIILDRNKIVSFNFLSNLPYIKSISINNNEIKALPLDSSFGHLQQLFLKGNKISSMTGIQKMERLMQIDLSDNQISIIQGLSSVGGLKILKLRKNAITQIKGIQELLFLEQLYLNGNQITQIKNLQALVKLNTLDLSDNQIVKIDGLEKLIQIKQLSLSNNKIQVIENIQTLKKMKKFKLNKNSIQVFQNLNGLIMLNDLDLSQNNMPQVLNIEEMNIFQLTNINFAKNKLEKCPDLTCLRQLTKVSLFSNKIKKISGLNGLIHLQELDLSFNQLTVIEHLQTLINLSSLNLSHNNIQQIAGLQSFEKLETLNLSCCQLKSIKNCEKLQQIETLLLNNNQIKTLKGLQNLKALKNLNVANNSISDCSDLKFNKKLQVLFINYNYIKELNLPLSLSELCLVKASENIIQKVPDLSLFEKLKKVFLERNEIKQLNVNELLAMKSLECINVEENHFTENVVYYRQSLGSKLLIN